MIRICTILLCVRGSFRMKDTITENDGKRERFIPKKRTKTIKKIIINKLYDIFDNPQTNKHYFHQKGVYEGRPNYTRIGARLDISVTIVYLYYNLEIRRKRLLKNKEYYQTDKYKEKIKEYHQTNKYKEYHTEYGRKHNRTDKYREYRREYYQKNRDKILQSIRKNER